MAHIKEYAISTIGEPAHVKIEKNSKGYNYELSLHGENLYEVLTALFDARIKIEKELLRDVWEGSNGSRQS